MKTYMSNHERRLAPTPSKAVGRALGMLGYGTQFGDDFVSEERATTGQRNIVDTPVERKPAPRQVGTYQQQQPLPKAPTRPQGQIAGSDLGNDPIFSRQPTAPPSASGSTGSNGSGVAAGTASTQAQHKLVFQLGRNAGLSEADVLDVAGKFFQRDMPTLDSMTKREASALIEHLKSPNQS